VTPRFGIDDFMYACMPGAPSRIGHRRAACADSGHQLALDHVLTRAGTPGFRLSLKALQVGNEPEAPAPR